MKRCLGSVFFRPDTEHLRVNNVKAVDYQKNNETFPAVSLYSHDLRQRAVVHSQ